MILMAIDPGVEAGVAVFDNNGKIVDTRLIKPTKGDWQQRVQDNVMAIRQLVTRWEPDWVCCEEPFYHSTEAGEAVAISGSLVKLAYHVGAVSFAVQSKGYDFRLIPVRMWKGQLPKPAVKLRIKQILGDKACAGMHEHVWDAVGIGLYVLGRFD